MTIRDVNSPSQMRPRRLQFDRYLLDLDRGCLLLDESEIPLRPKTFAILHHLVENCGRLVSKDELFAAVWPDLAVTDDVLVQSVGELRRALGDDGSRLIKTIPRRGYRFECKVSVVASSEQQSSDTAPGSTSTHSSARSKESYFIARSAGLLILTAFVALLVAGVLWTGVAIDWKFLNVAGYADRAVIKGPDIGTKPTIAVLPLVNQSDDSAREYFADGLTQDIINALGRFSEMTVMSWNAVFPYKGKPASPGEIARSLAVRYQVEGSVRQTGNRVRVTAQLVDTDGRVLWSGRFDEAIADLFALQDNITTQIAGALAIRVTRIEQHRVLAKPTQNLEAYDLVLRARFALQNRTRGNNVQARALLRQAIQIDPNYAAAYGALAETYYDALSMGWAESPATFLNRAEELADKALGLDNFEVRAHIIRGRIHIHHNRYKQAQAELDRAIAINPSDAYALASRGNILLWSGQTDAAIETLEVAQRIDPELNSFDRFALSVAYYLKRRYDAAIEQAELNLRKYEDANFSRILLAAAYAQQDRSEDVARIVSTIRRLDPTFDPQSFGSKLLNTTDLEHLRDGLRKAGLYATRAGLLLPIKDR